ncbi:flavodoxin domain-containing protein [Rhodococcus koreensis]
MRRRRAARDQQAVRQRPADDCPDLSPVRFAAFGLGDSTYENYNHAIATVVAAVTKLGANRIGVTARHDAASGLPPGGLVHEWTDQLLAEL